MWNGGNGRRVKVTDSSRMGENCDATKGKRTLYKPWSFRIREVPSGYGREEKQKKYDLRLGKWKRSNLGEGVGGSSPDERSLR